MIIKIQDDSFQDKHIVDAAYIKYDHKRFQYGEAGKTFIILEVYIVAETCKRSGSVSVHETAIEESPSLRLRVFHGDRVFIMNNDGKTIDSKRIDLEELENV